MNQKQEQKEDSLFGGDGYSATDVFDNKHSCTGYTYDDLIMLPGEITFDTSQVRQEILKKVILH